MKILYNLGKSFYGNRVKFTYLSLGRSFLLYFIQRMDIVLAVGMYANLLATYSCMVAVIVTEYNVRSNK